MGKFQKNTFDPIFNYIEKETKVKLPINYFERQEEFTDSELFLLRKHIESCVYLNFLYENSYFPLKFNHLGHLAADIHRRTSEYHQIFSDFSGFTQGFAEYRETQ